MPIRVSTKNCHISHFARMIMNVTKPRTNLSMRRPYFKSLSHTPTHYEQKCTQTSAILDDILQEWSVYIFVQNSAVNNKQYRMKTLILFCSLYWSIWVSWMNFILGFKIDFLHDSNFNLKLKLQNSNIKLSTDKTLDHRYQKKK